MQLMRRGEFAAAWQLSDFVLRSGYLSRCKDLPRHFQSVWDGSALEGKRVLIRCYHGLGDTIQFIRYAPLVKLRALEVTVLAQSELIPLVRTVEGIDRVFPLEAGDAGSDYDTNVEVMELPHVFRTTLETIPAQVPYLHVNAGSNRRSAERAAAITSPSHSGRGTGEGPAHRKLRVGIAWAAGDWDSRRSIPAELLALLANVTDAELHVFQRGPALDEPRSWIALTPEWSDVVEEARLMRAFDLMISVDSFPAHLAGALGIPAWTLLQKDADWRWLEGREDSPWYPTMRLFRQERAGDWEPVILSVAAELAKLGGG
jgi:hypothetical protein